MATICTPPAHSYASSSQKSERRAGSQRPFGAVWEQRGSRLPAERSRAKAATRSLQAAPPLSAPPVGELGVPRQGTYCDHNRVPGGGEDVRVVVPQVMLLQLLGEKLSGQLKRGEVKWDGCRQHPSPALPQAPSGHPVPCSGFVLFSANLGGETWEKPLLNHNHNRGWGEWGRNLLNETAAR